MAPLLHCSTAKFAKENVVTKPIEGSFNSR